MNRVWSTIAGLTVCTYLLKAAGPMLLGGRSLHPAVERIAGRLPAALLAALVVASSFAEGKSLVVDARMVGLAAASLALWRRASFVVVVGVAALATALARRL